MRFVVAEIVVPRLTPSILKVNPESSPGIIYGAALSAGVVNKPYPAGVIFPAVKGTVPVPDTSGAIIGAISVAVFTILLLLFTLTNLFFSIVHVVPVGFDEYKIVAGVAKVVAALTSIVDAASIKEEPVAMAHCPG